MISADIIVIGGGCVGLTAALGLADNGLSVAVVDANTAQKTLQQPQMRVSAISAASENIFRNLDVWELLEQKRLTPYQTMKVWDKHNFGKIEFSAAQLGESRLGHIIENDNIRNALIQKCQQQDNITLHFESEVTSVHNSQEQVLITLANGSPVVGKLLVAADGANSWVRKQLKIGLTFSDYDHHALVATIKTELPHQACARQVFLPDGPLALLPLFDEHTCSIVWSSSPEHVKQLQQFSDEEFNKAITAATDSELGCINIDSQRPSFPLTMRYAQDWVQQRVVFMGDAAHTIHPLAGLGMNLGLLDAASLCQLISDKNYLSEGELNMKLSRYQGWRKSEAQIYIAAMAGLKELFAGNNQIKKLIRGIGLSITNQSNLLKDQIIKQAMGLSGDLPELAQSKDPI